MHKPNLCIYNNTLFISFLEHDRKKILDMNRRYYLCPVTKKGILFSQTGRSDNAHIKKHRCSLFHTSLDPFIKTTFTRPPSTETLQFSFPSSSSLAVSEQDLSAEFVDVFVKFLVRCNLSFR